MLCDPVVPSKKSDLDLLALDRLSVERSGTDVGRHEQTSPNIRSNGYRCVPIHRPKPSQAMVGGQTRQWLAGKSASRKRATRGGLSIASYCLDVRA